MELHSTPNAPLAAFRFIQNHSGVAHMQNTFAFPFNRRKEVLEFGAILLLCRFMDQFHPLDNLSLSQVCEIPLLPRARVVSRNRGQTILAGIQRIEVINLTAARSNGRYRLGRRRISFISELNCGVWKEGGMRGYCQYLTVLLYREMGKQ